MTGSVERGTEPKTVRRLYLGPRFVIISVSFSSRDERLMSPFDAAISPGKSLAYVSSGRHFKCIVRYLRFTRRKKICGEREKIPPPRAPVLSESVKQRMLDSHVKIFRSIARSQIQGSNQMFQDVLQLAEIF